MIIIGDKLNASIPCIKSAIKAHDEEFLKRVATAQEAAGAGFIDINVGTGEGDIRDEMRDMEWLVGLIMDTVNGKICVDSADPGVLDAGLKAGGDRVGFINSVKNTQESISEILPIVAEKKDVSIIALAMGEEGIPIDVFSRIHCCEEITEHVVLSGISPERLYFDPLVMPISTSSSQGLLTLETLKELKRSFPCSKTLLALSNVSYGLPRRSLINQTFLNIAMYLSVDAILVNPLEPGFMGVIRATEAVLGKDRHCRKYTQGFRKGLLK